MKGLFITLEGGEGAGKSTLIESLYASLSAQGLKVLKTRAPGATGIGQAIRQLLLHREEVAIGARCELFLFLADRAQHVEEVIRPALLSYDLILCDRFNDSTIAYQAKARGFSKDVVKKLTCFAADDLMPDLTLYLDIDPAIGLERVQHAHLNKDRIESEELLFHQKIRSGFLEIAREEPKRFRIIDGSQPKDQVLKDALELINRLLA